jgi:hypothetical protein
MAQDTNTKPSFINSPQAAAWSGLGLFMLGMLSVLLVYVDGKVDLDTIKLVMGVAVLMSLGCTGLAIAGLRRLELRVKALEDQRRD